MKKGETMGKKNNQLRMLANLAKERMLNGGYSDTSVLTTYSNRKVSSYFLKNAQAMKRLTAKTEFVTIKNDEDIAFINKVVRMLETNSDIYNPLGLLADKKYMNSLSDIEKQSYILRLSDKYTKIKTAYYNGDLQYAN